MPEEEFHILSINTSIEILRLHPEELSVYGRITGLNGFTKTPGGLCRTWKAVIFHSIPWKRAGTKQVGNPGFGTPSVGC